MTIRYIDNVVLQDCTFNGYNRFSSIQSQLYTRKRPTGSWVVSTVCRPSHRYDHLTKHYNMNEQSATTHNLEIITTTTLRFKLNFPHHIIGRQSYRLHTRIKGMSGFGVYVYITPAIFTPAILSNYTWDNIHESLLISAAMSYLP